MTSEPRQIVIFAMGSVQPFISAARRTMDLAVASRIMSLLSEAALEAAEKIEKNDIVYPLRQDGKWPKSIPNRMVLVTPQGNGKEAGEAMEAAARKKWAQIANVVKGYVSSHGVPWDELADKQIEEWPEIYWIASPWDGVDSTYGSAYRQASLAFDARKSLRHFPVTLQPGRKCTLCGIRSALSDQENEWKNLSRKAGGSWLRPTERLCAVCAVKRFANKAEEIKEQLVIDRYPSTSSIASASYRATLLTHWDALKPCVVKYLDALLLALGLEEAGEDPSLYLQKLAKGNVDAKRFLRWDGDFFYPDFLTAKNVADSIGQKPQDIDLKALHKAMDALKALNKEVDKVLEKSPSSAEPLPPRPLPYYAVLMMDGDHMGELIDKVEDLEDHRKISQALTVVSVRMLDIIEKKYPGQMVYCGGDDVLALLPVNCALSAARDLRTIFTAELEKIGKPGRSVSAGMVIFHHGSPLEAALREARSTEHTAKEDLKRNALMVSLQKRSSGQRPAGLNWSREHTPEIDPIDVLDEVRALFASGKLSTKIAYDFLDEAPLLLKVRREAYVPELTRLIKRHCDKKQWDDRRDHQELAQKLVAFQGFVKAATGRSLVLVAEWLVLLRYLAQGDQS